MGFSGMLFALLLCMLPPSTPLRQGLVEAPMPGGGAPPMKPRSSEQPLHAIRDGELWCNGVSVMSGVDEGAFSAEEAGDGLGCVFLKARGGASLGGRFAAWQKRHMGTLPLGTRSLACARQKLWWMGPSVGDCHSPDAIPIETQFLLLSLPSSSPPDGQTGRSEQKYALVLPMVSGACRSSLSGSEGGGKLSITTETGCPKILPGGDEDLALVTAGSNPFELVREGIERLSVRSGTFTTREAKQLPGNVDLFGWCTWDAFYHGVSGWDIDQTPRPQTLSQTLNPKPPTLDPTPY